MARRTNTIEVSEVRIYKVTKGGNIKANASVTFNGELVVTGFKVMNGKNGLFVSFPSVKTSEGEYKDTTFPLTKELREHISREVLNQYSEDCDSIPQL